MKPPRDVAQQLADLPAPVQQQLLRLAVLAVSMSDAERAAAKQELVNRAYMGAKLGADAVVVAAEMQAACALLVKLTDPAEQPLGVVG